MKVNEVVIIMGYPGCGKTTLVEELPGYTRLNRDTTGKSLDQLVFLLDAALSKPQAQVVMDNTYATRKSRAPVIACCKKHKVPIRCIFLNASIEDAQYNVCQRMVERYSHVLMPDDIAASGDPNMFPPAVLFKYRKELEMPEKKEGFDSVEVTPFVRRPQPATFIHSAVIYDYDDTLRRTKSGAKWPESPDDIEILPGRKEKLQEELKAGKLLLGASNQSVISKGEVTSAQVEACFERTNKLLGVQIQYAYCPHNPAPIQCYCRKPMPGMFVDFIHRYKLDRKKVLYVGNATTDKTAASRALIQYMDQAKYFG